MGDRRGEWGAGGAADLARSGWCVPEQQEGHDEGPVRSLWELKELGW